MLEKKKMNPKYKKISLLMSLALVCAALVVGIFPVSATATNPGFNNPFGLFAAGGNVGNAYKARAQHVRIISRWGELEPQKGSYNYAVLDQVVSSFASKNIEVIVTLSDENLWGGGLDAQNQTPPGVSWLFLGYPSDNQAWLTFLGKTVERYDGDGYLDMPNLTKPVKYWQIENEWMWMWIDSNESFVQHTKESYTAIKAADQNAQVVTGAFTGIEVLAFVDGYLPDRNVIDVGTSDATRATYTREQLQAVDNPNFHLRVKVNYFVENAQGYFDLLDIHTYSNDPYVIPGLTAWMRDKFLATGYSPRFITTENAGPKFDYTVAEHANEVVTRQMLALESGYEKYAWSSLQVIKTAPDTAQRLSLTNGRTKKPAFYTYAILTRKLSGLTSLERIDMGDPNIYVYKAMVNNKPVYVMWHRGNGVQVGIPFQTSQALLTHIITTSGVTYPRMETLNTSSGTLGVNLTSEPIFIEEK